jgi:hypothetical protein
MKPFAIAMILTVLAGAAARAETTPAEMVADIYTIAAGPAGDYQVPSAITLPAGRRMLSAALRKAMDAMEERSAKTNEPILDFDPVTNSQDPSVIDLKIAPEAADAHHATVAASFAQSDKPARVVVRYIFVREAGEWKLDDIKGVGGGTKWDLRSIIKPK